MQCKDIPKIPILKFLIKRGLVSGCTCGCRGDFEITQKGLDFLMAKILQEEYELLWEECERQQATCNNCPHCQLYRFLDDHQDIYGSIKEKKENEET
jgi:hypothetical protein